MGWFVFFRSGITFWPLQPSFHIQYAFMCPGMDTYTQIRCSNVLHILDNFLLAEALPCASNLTSLGHLLCLFIELNVLITPGKTFAPSQSLKFLKITLDSVHMLALLPTHKLDRAGFLNQNRSHPGHSTIYAGSIGYGGYLRSD